jgi:hypothetical protein
MGLPLQPIGVDLAIRLADEGVPLRAIARATKLPSDEIRLLLEEAKQTGYLLELPHDDWPPGFPRDQRALELSRLLNRHQRTVPQKVAELFDLTPTETKLLLALIELTLLPREREDMTCNTLYVHISHLQAKLKAFGVEIDRVWGWGYRLQGRNQHIVTDLILQHVAVEAP